MKPTFCLFIAFGLTSVVLQAHPWHADMPPSEREVLRDHILDEWKRERAQHTTAGATSTLQLAAATVANAAQAPQAAKAFLPFTRLDLRADGQFLYVGSNGMPDHNMMVGITAWQQQVPLPQNYFGENAWRIPLHPKPAAQPAFIKGRFLRGAIALAVNGIPIFNPQNNRGEISYEIGELDQWGGHCGRADDYHYHIAPLHLQAQAGKGMPIAYALDGYPIYGLTEPDGSPVGRLDDCHGHETQGLGYHYHAAEKYPYVIGGFHGEVVELEGQVDPQPRANPLRPALQALRGARITGFQSVGKDGYKLSYEVNGDPRSVSYSIKADGTYPFTFDNGREGSAEEVYSSRGGGGGERGRPPQEPGKRKGGMRKGERPEETKKEAEAGVPARAPLPNTPAILDSNGDGIVTAQEFAENAKAEAARRGVAQPEALASAKRTFQTLDRNANGQLETSEWQTGATPPPPRVEPTEPAPPAPKGMPGKAMNTERGMPGGRKQESFTERPDQPRSSDGRFLLTSPAVEDMKEMPTEYTGDGEAATLPLAWAGAPSGTQSYALIMDHADREGSMKWYWTVYDIPAALNSLPRNAKNVGKTGTGFKGQVGYKPPHSRGPGAKVYVLTLYALSRPLELSLSPSEVNRETLLAAMKGKILASSSLRVVHVSQGGEAPAGRAAPATESEPPRGMNTPPPTAPTPPAPTGGLRPLDNIFAPPPQGAAGGSMPAPQASPREKGQGKPKGGPPGLVKPSLADSVKLNVYADNWFMLYVNGRLVAVDSIQFTPHNVVSVDFLPEYPMTIAVLAKDNADPKTGLEYGSSVGDGGFILKFADGTVTNASWKAKSFFHGPLGGDTQQPRVRHEPLPSNWWAVDFDDRQWPQAKEYTVEEVDPKQPYFDHDFQEAKFIWSDDIALDNTVIFRTRVEKPGWTPRWNTKPDLDVTGAPLR